MTAKPLIVLAAGGTGGHVFPAEALAAELLARGCRLALFTDRRGHAYDGALGGLDTYPLRAGALTGRSPLGLLKGAFNLALGTVQAVRLLHRLKPQAVVGFGGYASVPAMAAAALTGRASALHEQNAVLGRANRLLAGRVTRIATSFAAVRGLPRGDKAVMTGLPVRPAVLARAGAPYAAPGADDPINLLVLGGSQGARVLSDVLPPALGALPDDLRGRLRLHQQCRPEDLERVRAAYADLGIDAETAPFFDDVPGLLAAAHLLIARAGASTVAEAAVVGRPAILVPLPHATDDHQTANARAAEAAGAAWTLPQPDFTADGLARRLDALLRDAPALAAAAQAARAFGRPDAAQRLADLVEALLPAGSPNARTAS